MKDQRDLEDIEDNKYITKDTKEKIKNYFKLIK
jgi:hypothetical protein